MASTNVAPDLQAGLEYWKNTPATLDGVLGGFGNGTLPRVDAYGSRRFLQLLMTNLCTVPSVQTSLTPLPKLRRVRALDVGAGIGRVTSTVLLHLVDDVVLLEPIESFIKKAISSSSEWKGISDETKSVTFLEGPLQSFDPSQPLHSQSYDFHPHRVGSQNDDGVVGYDVVWCQWTLGHLSDPQLVSFFQQAKKSLLCSVTGRSREDGIIVVKENVCFDADDGGPFVAFDEEDSSLTRSNQAWHYIFKKAGLTLLREQTQYGFPQGLYEVKMYALR